MRARALAVVGLCLAEVACQQPVIGERATVAAPGEGPLIVIEDAWVDLFGHVVATWSVTEDDLPLSVAEVQALAPRFTLATLSAHPVDGLRAWKSQLLTGSGVAKTLKPSGPHTPPALVLQNVKQPGSETPATLVDLGGGRFRYVFTNALTSFDPGDTVRVGVWLSAASRPSLRTSTTYDFRPSGGPMEERDTVVDASCNGCHGNLVLHGTRAGVRLCLTCHTWQNADPDTIDPAALVTAATTADSDPNPLEFGRMAHRIHRGARLPTLYQSSRRANPAPALAAGNDLPLPFTPENNPTAIVGRKYSIVGFRSREFVYGRVAQRAEDGLGPATFVTGVVFPRDLRDCAACHRDARQSYAVNTAISRRTCAGCHPDVWYAATPALLDEARFPHPGGAQADDSACGDCHLQAAPGGKLYAPLEQVHAPLTQGVRYNTPRLEIVRVEGLRPGSAPRVTFRLRDRSGPVVPTPGAPSLAFEPSGSSTASFVGRAFSSLTLRVVGPTAADYGGAAAVSLSSGSSHPSGAALSLAVTPGTDDYVYTFTTLAATAPGGTWAVAAEGRRRLKYGHYDKATDTFRWPYTGETVTESPDNPVVYVDTATGTWPPDGPAPRRRIVAEQNCLRCHGRFELHGGTRHQVELCLLCHTPGATDWARRPGAPARVNLGATWDAIEERTIHLKVMVHRIHTGARRGAASLEAIEPHVIYGYGGTPNFFEGLFPADLANCTACHSGRTYLVDAVPRDAPPTVANETATIRHAANASAHVAGELSRPPIQAACTGCHASGATFEHVASKTTGGVEGCAQCHAKGPLAVDVVHGLAAPSGTVASSFSAIRDEILVPRCASAACHGAGSTQQPILDAANAWSALVNQRGAQSSLPHVTPGDAAASYLVYKLRGDVAAGGGSGALMPTDGALAPSDIAAIEAWIANGAQND